MSENTDDIDEIEVDILPPEKAKPAPTGKNGLGAVLVCSALATVLGAGGGAYLARYVSPAPQATQDFSSEFAASDKKLTTLTAKLERLEASVKDMNTDKASTDLPESLVDTSALDEISARIEATDLSPVIGRIETLEKAAFEPESLQGLTDINERINALAEKIDSVNRPENVSEASSESNAGFEESLGALEQSLSERLDALEQKEVPEVKTVNLAPVMTRLKSLEARVDSLPVTLPAFPRELVLQTMDGMETKEKQGWLARTFGGQIEVYDADIIARLDRIEANVTARDIDAITKDVASLPESVQEALKPWMTQIESLRINP